MVEQNAHPRLSLLDIVLHAFDRDDTETGIKTVDLQKIGQRRVSNRKLQDQIQKLLADRDTTRVDHLSIIGLEKVRDHFGDDWERVAPKGMKIAEGVLRAHLVATDIAVALGDMGYLILFNKLSKEEADVKAAMIAAGITNRLMGGIQDAQDIVTVTVSKTSDDGVLIEEKSVTDVVNNLVIDEASEASNVSRIPETGQNEIPGHKSKFPIESRENLTQTHDKINNRLSLADIQFIYKPIWDVRRKVLSTYH